MEEGEEEVSGCVEERRGEEGNTEQTRGRSRERRAEEVQEGSRGPEEVLKKKDRGVLIEKAHDERREEQSRLLALSYSVLTKPSPTILPFPPAKDCQNDRGRLGNVREETPR